FDGRSWHRSDGAVGSGATHVNLLFCDHEGRLWAGTSRGLMVLEHDRFVAFAPEGLDGKEIRALTEDRQHRLWVGGTDSVWVYDGEQLAATYSKTEGLPGSPIVAMREDRYDAMWIATHQGLGRIQHGQLTFLTARNGLQYSDVRSLLVDREGMIWIGVFG